MTPAERQLSRDLRTYFDAVQQFHAHNTRRLGERARPWFDLWLYTQGRAMGAGSERKVLPEARVYPHSRTCYLNAWHYQARHVRGGPLRYCEGYVRMATCPIPVMHGW